MELEIRELSNPDEKQRQLNSLSSFKAELKRLEQEYNLTKKRVKRHQDRRKLLNNEGDDYFEVEVHNSAKDRSALKLKLSINLLFKAFDA